MKFGKSFGALVTIAVTGVAVAFASCLTAAFMPAVPDWVAVLIVSIAIIVSCTHGWFVVKLAFEIADPPKSPLESGRQPLAPPEGTMRGGWIIGLLERAATTATIGTGQLVALAVIVAIKGVGRFGELDKPESRERFIIGTLASLGTAALWGVAAYLWTM